jgi:hypothetical protein
LSWFPIDLFPTLMNRIKRAGGWIFAFYILYLIKSALGISFFPGFSAARILKMPIAPIMEARYGKNWH